MGQSPEIAEISALLNASNEPAETVEEVVVEETQDEVVDTTEDVEMDDGTEVEEVVEETAEELMIEDITTLNALSSATGMEMSEIYDVEIGMGDNQEPIKLGKLKDEYQLSVRDNRQLLVELQQAQTQGQQSQQIAGEIQQAQQELYQVQKEYNDIDWERYENEQPGEAALSRQKFMEANQQAQYKVQQAQGYVDQQAQQSLQQSAGRLLELIPEWKDETTRKTEQNNIRGALITAGYTEQMLQHAQDPIAISLVRELLQLRAEKAGAGDAVKQVRKAPRVLRRANGQFAGNKDKNVTQLTQKARASGQRSDELAATKAILGIK